MKEYSNSFLRAMTLTMKTEGGYTEDGPTYRGIDKRYWADWPGWATVDRWKAGEISTAEMNAQLDPEVKHFYWVNFWNRVNGEQIAAVSPAVAYAVFDRGVNQDAPDGVRYLQDALNLLNVNQKLYPDIVVDGKPGPVTIDRLRRYFDLSPPSITVRRTMILNVMESLYQCRIIAWMRKDPTREKYRGLLIR